MLRKDCVLFMHCVTFGLVQKGTDECPEDCEAYEHDTRLDNQCK